MDAGSPRSPPRPPRLVRVSPRPGNCGGAGRERHPPLSGSSCGTYMGRPGTLHGLCLFSKPFALGGCLSCSLAFLGLLSQTTTKSGPCDNSGGLSRSCGGQRSDLSIPGPPSGRRQGCPPSRGSQNPFLPLLLLAAACVPWLVAVSLPTLPLWPRTPLLVWASPLKRTLVVAFRVRIAQDHLPTARASTKSRFPYEVTFLGSGSRRT